MSDGNQDHEEEANEECNEASEQSAHSARTEHREGDESYTLDANQHRTRNRRLPP